MSTTAAQVWENSSAFRRLLKQEVTAVLLRSSRCDCSSESTKLDTCTPWLDVLLCNKSKDQSEKHRPPLWSQSRAVLTMLQTTSAGLTMCWKLKMAIPR